VVVGTLRLRDEAASLSATHGGGQAASPAGSIVDPRTGGVVADDAVALVVAPTAGAAEAYSKALLLWGATGTARVERIGGTAAAHVSGAGIRLGPAAQRTRAFRAFPTPRPLAPAERPLA
jgi:hypothetical protein